LLVARIDVAPLASKRIVITRPFQLDVRSTVRGVAATMFAAAGAPGLNEVSSARTS
jgi:hypothetical protein